MSHSTQEHTPIHLTTDEQKALAVLLAHPEILKMIEESKKSKNK